MPPRDFLYDSVPSMCMAYCVQTAVDMSYEPLQCEGGCEKGLRGPADLNEWLSDAEPEEEEE